jgi:asparagine synthase (glutamine-hydrolysing)
LGVFLSGGIDSSLNVALMSELMTRPVDTYTVGFKELEKYNELGYARQIAKLFNTNHHEILIDHNDSIEILDKLVWHEDEPNADPVCMPLYFLSKLTRESGTIVVQVGEGSDEQFVGYKWMLQLYNFYKTYWKLFKSNPEFLRKFIFYLSKPVFSFSNQYLALDYLRRATFNEPLYWSGVSIFSPSFQKKLFNKNYLHLSSTPARYAQELYNQIHELKPDADFLQEIVFVEQQQRLAELLLMRVDKIGMAHSIEARVPFLDHRIVEFTSRIKPEQKVPQRNYSKYILKKAVEGIIPEEIINRKKQGFWAPVNEWLRTYWYDYSRDIIFNSNIQKFGIFNQSTINQLFVEHKTGKKNHGYELFTLLTLCLWYRRFID